MEVTTWSDCLEFYKELEKATTGTIEQIENIDCLDFKNFVESFKSCNPTTQEEEIRAVKTLLERKCHLKRCSIDPSRMSVTSDHWKILRGVFENVTVEELHVEGNRLNPNCMSHLARLCDICQVKALKLGWCEQANDLDISGNKLTPDCMIHLAKICKFCQVKSLRLGMCELGPEHFSRFAANTMNIKIEELDVGWNKLSFNCMMHLVRICEKCQVKSLKLGSSSLGPKHLRLFAENAENVKIDELDVSRNKLSADCMVHLAKICEKCQVKSLKLGRCDLVFEHLKQFAQYARNSKIYELDVFENKFTPECMHYLTKICEDCHVKLLKLGWLGLECEHLAKFAEDTKDVKLDKLVISRNKLPPDCMNELARICEVCHVKSLKLGCCNLESTHLKQFAKNAKIDELDISMNNDIFQRNLFDRLFAWLRGTKDSVFHLAKLCEICEVTKLQLRVCGLTSDQLMKFIGFARDTKIVELDIEGNPDISLESKDQLRKFLEFNKSKAEAEVDSTAAVPEIQVTKSSQEMYESHLNDTRIYSIHQHRKKGKVLIINNEFHGTTRHRRGSLVDLRNQERLWRALGFDVVIKKDISRDDMLHACIEFARDVRDVSAVVLIIMTHGGNERGKEFLEGEDGRRLYTTAIITHFNAEKSLHLQGIPKVFFFQACRGGERDFGIATDASVTRHPARSDMLIVYPSQSGHVSMRNETEGSWLMNAVANIFMQNAHDTHLLDMLTMVNDAVASKQSEFGDVQMSNQESYMRKRFFLYPGWPV